VEGGDDGAVGFRLVVEYLFLAGRDKGFRITRDVGDVDGVGVKRLFTPILCFRRGKKD